MQFILHLQYRKRLEKRHLETLCMKQKYITRSFLIKIICLCTFGLINPVVVSSQQITVSTQVDLINQRNRDVVAVNQLWTDYLQIGNPDSLYNNPYWNDADKDRYVSYDLLRSEGYYHLYSLAEYGDLRNLILSVTPIEDGYDIRSMYYWPVSTPFILAITHCIAKRDDAGEFKLYNWLHYYSRDWKSKQVGKITYYYNPEYHFNKTKARRAEEFLDFLTDTFEIRVDHLDIYISKGWSDTEKLKGYEYTVSSTIVNDYDLGGTVDTDNNIIYSNSTKGEFYEHEMVRLINPFYPNAHRLFLNGLSEYYTEDRMMRGVSLKEHFRRFDEYLDAHPEIDLKNLDTFDAGNLAEVNYLLGLVIVNLTLEKGGYDFLKEAMRTVNTDDQMRDFITDKLGINEDDINLTFRSIIDKNKF